MRLLEAEGGPVEDGLFGRVLHPIAVVSNELVKVLHLGDKLSIATVCCLVIFGRFLVKSGFIFGLTLSLWLEFSDCFTDESVELERISVRLLQMLLLAYSYGCLWLGLCLQDRLLEVHADIVCLNPRRLMLLNLINHLLILLLN